WHGPRRSPCIPPAAVRLLLPQRAGLLPAAACTLVATKAACERRQSRRFVSPPLLATCLSPRRPVVPHGTGHHVVDGVLCQSQSVSPAPVQCLCSLAGLGRGGPICLGTPAGRASPPLLALVGHPQA